MRLIVLTIGLSLTLAACGIKPNQVSAPPELKKDTFPKTYPDPATDPKPEKK